MRWTPGEHYLFELSSEFEEESRSVSSEALPVILVQAPSTSIRHPNRTISWRFRSRWKWTQIGRIDLAPSIMQIQ